jgi:mono/diheme cytochrome c family protein
MKPTLGAILLVLVFSLAGVCRADDPETAFKARVLPVLSASCMKCHGPEKQKGKVNFAAPRSADAFAADPKLWFRVLDQIESGTMPPDGEKPLSAPDRQAIAGWVRGELTEMLAAKQAREGRSRLRRLSRSEYANTILDLFGFRPAVGRELPSDGRVDGYAKVSGALPMSSSGAAGYVQMTEDVLKRMLRPIPKDAQGGRTTRATAFESEQSKGHILELEDGTKVSFNTDTTSGPLRGFNARVPGIHRLRLSVYAYQTDKPLAFGIYAGHTAAYPQLIDLVKVLEAPPGKATVIETEVYFRTADDNDLARISDSFRLIPFGLGVQVPKNSIAKNCKGPGLAVQWVDIIEPELPLQGDRWLSADFPPTLQDEMRRGNVTLQKSGPKGPPQKSTSREEFMAVMQATFKRIGARFYHRELTSAELTEILTSIVRQLDAGATISAAFLDQVGSLMTSPDFLCVLEKPGALPDYALATRLSYFLWNSSPDEPLLEAAKQGRLRDPKVLREQTERLLKDPKSARFVNDFVDQWLGLRAIGDTTPDAKLYPEYDELLKISSVMETQASIRRILDENLSVREFVAPKWALVNERLARHYGLAEVKGLQLQKVALPDDSQFGGLWTQSAVLKVTANGTNTSPVKRGVWVSERLLGIRIPPPPPNVNPVEPDVRGAKTLREQLALHRGNGSCASCHARFDPYGFALESFDVTGSYRQHYREPGAGGGGRSWRDGLPVDCSGTTPDGRPFAGIRELRELLAKRPDQLARGVTRHLVTYATGAPSTVLDEPAIDRIVKAASPDDYGLRSLIHALIQSELFRWK